MSAPVPSHLSAAASAHPILAGYFSIIACIGTIFLIIREIFTPVGKRRSPQGKKWKLPPGPRGIPIFGNLLDLRKAREDQEHSIVSSSSMFKRS
jgi:hypothetical protein